MNEFWIVRFIRRDGKPNEEYYYSSLADAEQHRNLFLDDDSGLYEKIEIVNEKTKDGCAESICDRHTPLSFPIWC